MLTFDAASHPVGPSWLKDFREAGVERFNSSTLPTSEAEVWRYSRIDDLDLDRYSWVSAAPSDSGRFVPEELQPVLDALPDAAGVVVIRDGWVTYQLLDEKLAERGIGFGRLSEVDTDGDGCAAKLGSVTTSSSGDAIAALHDAALADPVVISIPNGEVVEAPFVVLNWISSDGGLSCPHLLVLAGENSEATVLIHHKSSDVDALVIPVVELDLAAGSRLSFVDAQSNGPRVWQLGRQMGNLDRDATLKTSMIALGGEYSRSRIGSTLSGKGASVDMSAVYFGEGSQMHDVRTTQHHVAPHTDSSLLFKGAVQGHARSVYSGLVRIGKQGAGSNASQTNRNLTLSRGAWAESVPTLEIENNDVRCSHASAVGPIDEEQRFYLESRGVPPIMADRLIVMGFFDEVLDELPFEGIAELARAELAAKLDRREIEDVDHAKLDSVL